MLDMWSGMTPVVGRGCTHGLCAMSAAQLPCSAARHALLLRCCTWAAAALEAEAWGARVVALAALAAAGCRVDRTTADVN